MDESVAAALLTVIRHFKQADVTMQCQLRFDRLMELKATLPDENANESEFLSYHRRFWELQHDQFLYWLKGYLDEDFYAVWLMERKSELDEAKVYKTHHGELYTCKDVWLKVCKKRYAGRDFENFMNVLMESGPKEALRVFRPRPFAPSTDAPATC